MNILADTCDYHINTSDLIFVKSFKLFMKF